MPSYNIDEANGGVIVKTGDDPHNAVENAVAAGDIDLASFTAVGVKVNGAGFLAYRHSAVDYVVSLDAAKIQTKWDADIWWNSVPPV